MNSKEDIISALKAFQDKCIGLATGMDVDYEEYEQSRNRLLEATTVSSSLPEWVVKCRYGSQYWGFIKKKAANYQGRREFIWNTLGPIIESVERSGTEPIGKTVDRLIKIGTSNSIEECWHRVLGRKEEDPEAAITAARSMVESSCKYILDECEVTYRSSDDLNQLYKKVSKELKLSPSEHDEQIFKQILSGCSSIISGFAGLRNAYGDAHGKGLGYCKPSPRHAELAINVAGTMTAFLMETHNQRKANKITDSDDASASTES